MRPNSSKFNCVHIKCRPQQHSRDAIDVDGRRNALNLIQTHAIESRLRGRAHNENGINSIWSWMESLFDVKSSQLCPGSHTWAIKKDLRASVCWSWVCRTNVKQTFSTGVNLCSHPLVVDWVSARETFGIFLLLRIGRDSGPIHQLNVAYVRRECSGCVAFRLIPILNSNYSRWRCLTPAFADNRNNSKLSAFSGVPMCLCVCVSPSQRVDCRNKWLGLFRFTHAIGASESVFSFPFLAVVAVKRILEHPCRCVIR